MRVRFTKRFSKQYDRSPQKVKNAFNKKLELFIRDSRHPILNNHPLIGQYKGFRSINVTGDWRALYSEFESSELVFFEFIGTHSQLYN